MRTVSALFDTYDEVVAAVDLLADMGIASSDITVVTHGRHATSKIAEGAGLGAALGSVGGVLATLGAVAIPGPVCCSAWAGWRRYCSERLPAEWRAASSVR